MSKKHEKHEFINGLSKAGEDDIRCFNECMSRAIPLTLHWEDSNNESKIITWDSDVEKYLAHRRDLIENEGRKNFLPWNLYRDLKLSWLDKYSFHQRRTGDCCSFGHKNSLKASNLTNAKLYNRKPIEIAHSMTYAIARGNGEEAFGSGSNLYSMSYWAAKIGNYWTSDFGKYDEGVYCRKYDGAYRDRKPFARGRRRWNRKMENNHDLNEQDRHALQTQSVIIYLPEPNFDLVFAVCSAGLGINMGTETYPNKSQVNSDGLAVPSDWAHGGHSMAFVAAYVGASGERYVYLENSHGNRYKADDLFPNKQFGSTGQPGCWCSETDVKEMAKTIFLPDRGTGGREWHLGKWYVNTGELPENNS